MIGRSYDDILGALNIQLSQALNLQVEGVRRPNEVVSRENELVDQIERVKQDKAINEQSNIIMARVAAQQAKELMQAAKMKANSAPLPVVPLVENIEHMRDDRFKLSRK